MILLFKCSPIDFIRREEHININEKNSEIVKFEGFGKYQFPKSNQTLRGS